MEVVDIVVVEMAAGEGPGLNNVYTYLKTASTQLKMDACGL